MNTTPNTLPPFNAENDDYVTLPLHVMDTKTHTCIHCGEAPIWDNYLSYLEHWWTQEYEGDPGHEPDGEESFDMVESTCLAVPA